MFSHSYNFILILAAQTQHFNCTTFVDQLMIHVPLIKTVVKHQCPIEIECLPHIPNNLNSLRSYKTNEINFNNISNILIYLNVVNITIMGPFYLLKIFCTKTLKSGLCLTLIQSAFQDWLHFKCSVAPYGLAGGCILDNAVLEPFPL